MSNKINDKQKWKEETFLFDPDSSPDAWDYYKKIYDCIFVDYDFDKLTFFNYIHAGKYKGYYSSHYLSRNSFNRLYALIKDVTIVNCEKGILYYKPCLRLSGDTDFNFNKDKCERYKELLRDDREALELLSMCGEMHHTLQNFSLMQTVGNLQGFKSKGLEVNSGKYEHLDRLDSFVYKLAEFYEANNREETSLARNAGLNKNDLITFLERFEDIYDYCHKTYFINDDLINDLIENGSRPIIGAPDVRLYMDLAQRFWNSKDTYMP